MVSETTARLLIRCPDRPGIVAAVSNFLFHHGANITALDQYSTDPEGGTFFLRLEFQTPHLDVSRPLLERTFGETVGQRYGMAPRGRVVATGWWGGVVDWVGWGVGCDGVCGGCLARCWGVGSVASCN